MAKLHTAIETKVPTRLDDNAGKHPLSALQPLFTWTAPERYWTPKDRVWYVAYAFFFSVIIALAALLGQYLLIMAVISFAFLWFVQGAIKAEIISHQITPLGIRTFGKLLKWQDISHFWFSEKHGELFLHIDVPDINRYEKLDRYSLLLEKQSDDTLLFGLLIEYINYGTRDSAGYNILARFIHGRYIPMTYYLPEENYFDDRFEASEDTSLQADTAFQDSIEEPTLDNMRQEKRKKAVTKSARKKTAPQQEKSQKTKTKTRAKST